MIADKTKYLDKMDSLLMTCVNLKTLIESTMYFYDDFAVNQEKQADDLGKEEDL